MKAFSRTVSIDLSTEDGHALELIEREHDDYLKITDKNGHTVEIGLTHQDVFNLQDALKAFVASVGLE